MRNTLAWTGCGAHYMNLTLTPQLLFSMDIKFWTVILWYRPTTSIMIFVAWTLMSTRAQIWKLNFDWLSVVITSEDSSNLWRKYQLHSCANLIFFINGHNCLIFALDIVAHMLCFVTNCRHNWSHSLDHIPPQGIYLPSGQYGWKVIHFSKFPGWWHPYRK